MSTQLAAPTYTDDLGGGLVRRWSTAADIPKLARLMGVIYRDSPDSPPLARAMDVARALMDGTFPYMGAGDFALIEDTSRPGRPVIAYTCLWRHRWDYGGIPFDVGQPEMVATDPDYRNRGLVRAIFDMIHARSAAKGDLVQVITGIPYFYRQFDYEFVLDLDGYRAIPTSAVPEKTGDGPEPYGLRPALLDDIPQLRALYEGSRRGSLVWREASDAFWEHHITSWDDPYVRTAGAMKTALFGRLHLIVDAAGQTVGSTWLAVRRWDNDLKLFALEFAPHVNWGAAVPSLLRALCSYGQRIPATENNRKPFSEIRCYLGRTHPLYDLFDGAMPVQVEPPYAWYLRVADVPGFVLHIAPVLEARLAGSVLAGYTGELKIDFYRGGLQLQIEGGALKAAEPWRAPAYGDVADAGCPPLVFLQLLFCYRSLAELRAFLPDVWAKPEAALLLDVLFPKQHSFVHPLTAV